MRRFRLGDEWETSRRPPLAAIELAPVIQCHEDYLSYLRGDREDGKVPIAGIDLG
jgi:hypothetical protein